MLNKPLTNEDKKNIQEGLERSRKSLDESIKILQELKEKLKNSTIDKEYLIKEFQYAIYRLSRDGCDVIDTELMNYYAQNGLKYVHNRLHYMYH